MRSLIYSAIFLLISSCTAVKLSVPEQFSQQATKLPVKGLHGWMINQQLSFGEFHTSKIKRGWDFGSSLQYTKFRVSPEEMMLRVFNIETDKKNLSQKNKFQYTISSGQLEADVYATEKFTEKQLVYKSNNPYIGSVSKTNKYEYAFTAAILPVTKEANEPWSLVLINKFDIAQNQGIGIFEEPYVEEEGYATNGVERITIRPLRVDKLQQKNGKETKVFGGKILSGYELKWDDGVVAIIDILDNNIWIANNLDAQDKLIISSISSAILLKRMQDVAQDKDNLDN